MSQQPIVSLTNYRRGLRHPNDRAGRPDAPGRPPKAAMASACKREGDDLSSSLIALRQAALRVVATAGHKIVIAHLRGNFWRP
jgi:hypothetical protein